MASSVLSEPIERMRLTALMRVLNFDIADFDEATVGCRTSGCRWDSRTMAIFSKRAISSRCAQQLRAMADADAVVEVEPIDSEGQSRPGGRSRIFQFDADQGHLIVDVPTRSGRPIALHPGELVRVLALFGGSIYTFEAAVVDRDAVSCARGLVSVVRLEAPERLANGNRRRHFRVVPKAASPMRVKWRFASVDPAAKNRRPWRKARVSDISGRGAGLWIEPKAAEGVEVGAAIDVEIVFQLPSGEKQVQTRAKVRRVRLAPDGSRAMFSGVEFNLDERDRDDCIEDLVAYVTWRQREIARNQSERE